MNKQYDVEFKKELVREYQKGASLNNLSINYGVTKSTIAGWVKRCSEECHYTKTQTKENNISPKELRDLK